MEPFSPPVAIDLLPPLETSQLLLDRQGIILFADATLLDWMRPIYPQGLSRENLRKILLRLNPAWEQHMPERFFELQAPAFLPWGEEREEASGGLELRILEAGDQLLAALQTRLPPEAGFGSRALNEMPTDPVSLAQVFLRLRNAESRLHNYTHNFPGIFFSQRSDFSFSFLGPAFEEKFGTQPQRLKRNGNDFIELILEADRSRFINEVEKQARFGQTFSINFRIRHPQQGNILHFLDVRTPLRAPSGHILGYEGVWLDTTRQAIAENRLSRTAWKESLATVTSGLVHDFSNIMAGIFSLSELYFSSLQEDHPWYRGMGQIMRNSREARKLVRRIIDLNREIAGQPNYYNCENLLKEQLDLIRIILPKHVKVHTDFSGEELPVYLDDVSFRQVILNFAMNTKDALRRNGEVRIGLRRAEAGHPLFGEFLQSPFMPSRDGLLLSFADNGCGIAPDHLSKIFDPFFTTKEAHKGSGFGLYNARLFVRQCGGRIEVDSTPGVGTTFYIYLPLADFTEGDNENGASESASSWSINHPSDSPSQPEPRRVQRPSAQPPLPPQIETRLRLALYTSLDMADFELIEHIQTMEWEVITFSDRMTATHFLADKVFRPHGLIIFFLADDPEAERLLETARLEFPTLRIGILIVGRNPDEISPKMRGLADLVLDDSLRPDQILHKISRLIQPIPKPKQQ